VLNDRSQEAWKFVQLVVDVHIMAALLVWNLVHALKRRPKGGGEHGINTLYEKLNPEVNAVVAIDVRLNSVTFLIG